MRTDGAIGIALLLVSRSELAKRAIDDTNNKEPCRDDLELRNHENKPNSDPPPDRRLHGW